MKKSYILGIVLVLTTLSVISVFWIANKSDKKSDSNIVENEKIDSAVGSREDFFSTVDINEGWESPGNSQMLDEWKIGDEPLHENLIQEAIQQMAHQKIIAESKLRSIMITPKRIDVLLQIVEGNKDKYEYSDKYLDILKRWKKGDFTKVDEDHNIIMQIQGHEQNGTATGIATEEQEIHYILQVFGKSVDKVFDSSTLKEFENEDTSDKPTSTEVKDLSWVNEAHAELLDDWKSGVKTFDERLVQKVLLDMAHFKSETHIEKGSMEITSKRMDNLMQIIEEEKAVFFHYQTYVDILNRWEKGDFSTIDDDHERLHSLYDR